jgi:hypothetical protein
VPATKQEAAMAGEGDTATVFAALAPARHLSLAAACLGFLGSTLGLTVLMVLLSHA